jgi:hypothetical protein
MKKIASVVVFGLTVVCSAFAGAAAVPEISGQTGVAAVGLVSGAILILRSRRKRS